MLSNFSNRKGAVMIEYGLLAALIAIGLVVGIKALTTNLNGTFTKVTTELK